MWRWVSTKPGITIMRDGVDHLGIGRADVRPHRGDLAALDQHVGLLEVADRAVEREHAAALDQDRAARSGRAAGLCARAVPTDRAGDGRGGDGAPAAVVQRNCRRDTAGDGGQHELQAQKVMVSSRVCCCDRWMLSPLRGRF